MSEKQSIPDAEQAIISYFLKFPNDDSSFKECERRHFEHPVTLRCFRFLQEVKQSPELDWLRRTDEENFASKFAQELGKREKDFPAIDVCRWPNKADSNTFSIWFRKLDEQAEDREKNGGIRFYFEETVSSHAGNKFIQDCPYPEDSIIHPFVKAAQKVVESSDSMIVGCAMGMIAGLMGRNIWFNFDRKKYPNVYCILSASPGDRKSSIIGFSKRLTRSILGDNAEDYFLSDASSPESLFDEFEQVPDRVWITDEGNPVLHGWATTSYGAGVSKRLLSIYDCEGIRETFRRNKTDDNASGTRVIVGTSLSMVMGCTFAGLRTHRLEAKDGLRRRFLNYVSSGPSRTIHFPEQLSDDVWNRLVDLFKQVQGFTGEVCFAHSARQVWIDFQNANRKRISESDSDELRSLLAEEPAHVLKVAMIFQAARAAAGNVPWNTLSPETLEIAIRHVRGCVDASESIDSMNRSEELEEIEDYVFAAINDPISEFARELGTDAILATKSQLTRTFSKRGKGSKIPTTDLYRKVIPSLMNKGLCAIHSKEGKKITYRFKNESVR